MTIIFQILLSIIEELNITVLAESNQVITEIYTKEDFFKFIEDANKGYEVYRNKKVKLMRDIDLNTSIKNPCKSINPSSGFYGEFDGQNHTIYNLYLKNSLFNQCNGSIRNLKIEKARNSSKPIRANRQ